MRTKKEQRRSDGRYIRFDTNAAVLLNNKKEPLGTRINGVVSAELRNVSVYAFKFALADIGHSAAGRE